jgi:hypothetical protein
MLATFERHLMGAFLGLVHDNVGNAAELTALWRLLEQALSVIHSSGDATGQVASPGSLPCVRSRTLLAPHVGVTLYLRACRSFLAVKRRAQSRKF